MTPEGGTWFSHLFAKRVTHLNQTSIFAVPAQSFLIGCHPLSYYNPSNRVKFHWRLLDNVESETQQEVPPEHGAFHWFQSTRSWWCKGGKRCHRASLGHSPNWKPRDAYLLENVTSPSISKNQGPEKVYISFPMGRKRYAFPIEEFWGIHVKFQRYTPKSDTKTLCSKCTRHKASRKLVFIFPSLPPILAGKNLRVSLKVTDPQ